MIEAVIFDAWGTLFFNAEEPSPLSLMNRYLNKTFHDKKYLDVFEEVTALDTSEDIEAEARTLLAKIHMPTDGKSISTVAKFLRQAFTGEIRMYDDAVDALPRLKQYYKIGLLSNSGLSSANNLRKRFPLNEMFDHILFSYQVGVLKPDAAIFHAMLEMAGVLQVDSAVFIGDHPGSDCWGANASGLQALLIDRKNQNAEQPFKRCQTLAELDSLLFDL